MTMSPKIGEINIICTELERSLRFYRDVLGFEAKEAEGSAWHMTCGSVRFLLLAVATQPSHSVPYCAEPELSIDLMVDNLQQAFRHCQAHGVEFVSEFEPNQDRFMIYDPDGLVFEVIQASKTAE